MAVSFTRKNGCVFYSERWTIDSENSTLFYHFFESFFLFCVNTINDFYRSFVILIVIKNGCVFCSEKRVIDSENSTLLSTIWSIACAGRGSAIKIGFSSILGRPSLKVFETSECIYVTPRPERGSSIAYFSPPVFFSLASQFQDCSLQMQHLRAWMHVNRKNEVNLNISQLRILASRNNSYNSRELN